jgi:hypothetical protein
MNDKVWIASFDIGKKNFAFCVEEVSLQSMSSIHNVDSKYRFYKDGTPTPEFNVMLKSLCSSGKIILLDNVDLSKNCDNNKSLDSQVFINMNNILDKHKLIWDKCICFVIEQQMSFKQSRNTIALKLGQHCFSYFIFHYANFKKTIEFPAYYKTKILGAHKKMNKQERKAWAVSKALEILADRNDEETMLTITSRKKRDDVADALVQLQAYKYLIFIDKSI